MIAVVHYTDENLIAMLEAGDEEAIRRNPHLASCDACRQSLDEYRTIVGVLADEAAWTSEQSPDPDPSTVATLRAFATSMHHEDEAAMSYVAALLEGGRETWMPRLRAHPEWRTAAVVRKLVADSFSALTKLPPDGLEMTALAVDIAEHLADDAYPADVIARARGHAWREHAYNLFYTGDFKQSLAACDRADAVLSRCVVDEYDLARVGVVRALILQALEQIQTGIALAENAMGAFARFGDQDRIVAAALSAAQMRFKTSDYREALQILRRVNALADKVGEHNRAALENNIAYCYHHLGDDQSAIHHYQISSAIFDEIGSVTDSVRVRWNIADLLTAVGRVAEALQQLIAVRAEFIRLGMTHETCVSAIEMADLLLVESRFEEAESLCRETAAQLETSGLGTTSRAMTAVAFLTEAMKSRAATPKLVRHVREYVRRLPEEPNLLFAPPLL